ncbi:MAG TPA: hypothetical protein VKP00_01545, partial [Gemmatimonadaceae bacterium]|nr:hypothetical protein [Gemmatimonadaceae bacterium]
MLKKVALMFTGIGVVFSIAACSEKLEAGKSCPLLCPEQAITLRDTIIDAAVSDTTVGGLPPIGAEGYLMLASHGDTVETRAIVRYDTLPQTYSKSGVDSTIVNIDSAYLVTPIVKPDSLKRPKVPLTIEAYDIDTTATDTVAAVLAPLFRPDRLIGSKTFAPESLLDTLRIPISTDSVLDRVKNGTRLRVGLRIVSTQGVDLRVGSTSLGLGVSLRIKASKDTTASAVIVAPVSRTPKDQPFLSGPLADFTIVVSGTTSTPATLLGVGGVPSRRSYIRFNVPSHIIDSTTVVRASLLLTQAPNRRLDLHDSVYVYPLAVLASPAITDIGSLLQFVGPPGQFNLDSLRLAPADSGVVSFEIVGLVRTWRGQPTTVSPRSVALRSGAEGQ